jgi:hypothetical protein
MVRFRNLRQAVLSVGRRGMHSLPAARSGTQQRHQAQNSIILHRPEPFVEQHYARSARRPAGESVSSK